MIIAVIKYKKLICDDMNNSDLTPSELERRCWLEYKAVTKIS